MANKEKLLIRIMLKVVPSVVSRKRLALPTFITKGNNDHTAETPLFALLFKVVDSDLYVQVAKGHLLDE